MALISEFEKLSEQQLQVLWRDGMFVFDTSVLLSLHRYRNEVMTDFLKGVGAIRNQIWMPFQVAMEYENNRPKVIAEKRRLLDEVKSKVASVADEVKGQLGNMGAMRRHSHVDAEGFIAALKAASEAFCKTLDELAEKSPGISDEDPVRRAIEKLFSGCIGGAPATQEEIDALNESAKKRYSVGWPPGYLDQTKDGGGVNAYAFHGMIYQRKNGDLYLWDQIKKRAKSKRAKAVCLVTDDQKEDWWWTVDSQGKKRLGPRPELREEIFRESGVEIFAMQTPDSFLESLNRFKNTGIQPNTIDEAREISLERKRLVSGAGPFGRRARAGVYRWCLARSENSKVFERDSFPDFIELDNDDKIRRGFEVIPVISPALEVGQRIERRWSSIEGFLASNPSAELRLIFVFGSAEDLQANLSQIREFDVLPDQIILCAGYMAGSLYRHSKCFVRADASSAAKFG